MISRYFPPKHSYGRVLGFVYFLFAMGSATGVFILGQVYGLTGSYGAGIVPIVAMVVVAIVCLLGMGAYRYSLDHRDLTDDAAGDVMGPGGWRKHRPTTSRRLDDECAGNRFHR